MDDSRCLRRDGLILFSPILEGGEEAPAMIRRPSRLITLRILAMHLPLQIVDIVEANVGWPEIFNDIQEDDRVLHDPIHRTEILRLARAVRDIYQNTWTPDISYLLGNLQAFTNLLESLLGELELLRRVRSSATLVQLVADVDDFNSFESAVEVLANDFARANYLAVHLDHNRHIPIVRQLSRFLNYPGEYSPT